MFPDTTEDRRGSVERLVVVVWVALGMSFVGLSSVAMAASSYRSSRLKNLTHMTATPSVPLLPTSAEEPDSDASQRFWLLGSGRTHVCWCGWGAQLGADLGIARSLRGAETKSRLPDVAGCGGEVPTYRK